MNMDQRSFNRNLESLSKAEILDILVKMKAVPAKAFFNEFAEALLDHTGNSGKVNNYPFESNESTSNNQLLNRLNYRNGIHYSVTRNLI